MLYKRDFVTSFMSTENNQAERTPQTIPINKITAVPHSPQYKWTHRSPVATHSHSLRTCLEHRSAPEHPPHQTRTKWQVPWCRTSLHEPLYVSKCLSPRACRSSRRCSRARCPYHGRTGSSPRGFVSRSP